MKHSQNTEFRNRTYDNPPPMTGIHMSTAKLQNRKLAKEMTIRPQESLTLTKLSHFDLAYLSLTSVDRYASCPLLVRSSWTAACRSSSYSRRRRLSTPSERTILCMGTTKQRTSHFKGRINRPGTLGAMLSRDNQTTQPRK